MENLKLKLSQGLEINAASACRDAENLIVASLKKLNRSGAVVSLSGGLDSAVTAALTVNSLGRNNVHLLNMPERDSHPLHQAHAKDFARYLKASLTVRNITSPLRASGTYSLLPISLLPFRRLRAWLVNTVRKNLLKQQPDVLAARFRTGQDKWVSRGIAYAITKHRMRLVVAYQFAELNDLMVVGAANRTEWCTGTFSQWGVDHCADVMPIVHLYRCQVEQMAAYLEIPDYIRNKSADPDVLPGIQDKGSLLGGFTVVDQILYGLENQIPSDALAEIFDPEIIHQVQHLQQLSAHMREAPYTLEALK